MILKKAKELVKSVEDQVFDENNERNIDMSLPGYKKEINIKKHKTGIYSKKETTINYWGIGLAVVVIIGIIILNLVF